MDTKQLHEQILYPVTRVRQKTGGGSGVIVYSAPDVKNEGQYINIVLTCEHVVDKLIDVKEEWDSVLKRDRKTDIFEEATVDIFDYAGSKVISSNATKAEIIAYDKAHDLAALKLLNPRKMEHVSRVIPKADIKNLRLFDPVWVSGCSLLHDPFASPGTLTYLREVIEQKSFLMANAPSVFGNSGGGLFDGTTGNLLGLTSRVTLANTMFGVDIMTWMEFSTHPERLYEFFEHNELQFLYDPKDDYYAASERREKKRKDAMRQLLFEKPEEKKREDSGEYPYDPRAEGG